MDQTVALSPLWDRIWARRRPVLAMALAAATVVAAIAFLLPNWYRAETELLPPSDEESGVGLASLLRGVGVPGVKIPTQVSAGDVFLAILESRRVNEQIVNRFDLKKRYKVKMMTDALKHLREHTDFKLTDAGTIRISAEDTDRRRAADMANAYVELLDEFNREVRTSKGRRTRTFIEGRLVETRRELAAAEQRLAQYQVRNKTVALSSQASSAVDQAARLYARRMSLQVRLGVVRGFSDGSEEEIQIRQELDQIEHQMQELPGTGLELGRLFRDVKAFEQVFILLTAQHEDARITEARDVVTVEVLDVATPPEKKSRPRRLWMIAGALVLGLLLGVGHALLDERGRLRGLAQATVPE